VTPVTRLGFVAHPDRAEALDLVARAVSWCESRGIQTVVAADPVADGAAGALGDPARLDAVVSFGGDGTMLRSVDLVATHGVPVLGVNCGQLGYLTAIEPAQLDDALDRLQRGDYEISERAVLQATVESSGGAAGTWTALNELVLEKPHPGRLVRFEVAINGSVFTSYAADGMILATPTGSTAYSFSAGGPIVSPRLACLLMTPVSPHMLFDRTLVVDDRDQLEVTVIDRPALLTVDGRELGEVEPGAVVRGRCSGTPARMITIGRRDFHQILKAKFGLSDR